MRRKCLIPVYQDLAIEAGEVRVVMNLLTLGVREPEILMALNEHRGPWVIKEAYWHIDAKVLPTAATIDYLSCTTEDKITVERLRKAAKHPLKPTSKERVPQYLNQPTTGK
jgi:hypothetical protein